MMEKGRFPHVYRYDLGVYDLGTVWWAIDSPKCLFDLLPVDSLDNTGLFNRFYLNIIEAEDALVKAGRQLTPEERSRRFILD